MGVDKETAPNYVNIWIEDNAQMLKEMRKAYKEEGWDDEETNQLVLCDMNGFSLECEEYYFEEREGNPELYISFNMMSSNGKVMGTLGIPLSDIVLIDILQYAIKKLNKLNQKFDTLNLD